MGVGGGGEREMGEREGGAWLVVVGRKHTKEKVRKRARGLRDARRVTADTQRDRTGK